MRTELSSLDLHFLIRELKALEGSKIDKVFQKENLIIFQVHIIGRGKAFLKIALPSFILLGESKESFGDSGKFALSLRKHLDNARIREICQVDFERIIKLTIETKSGMINLYTELFRPGNLILCDGENKVIMAFSYKGFGSRLIRPNIQYSHPKKEFNFLGLSETDLAKLIDDSDKSSIVVTLATNLGLGGLYAEEVCIRAGIDKKKTSLIREELIKLHKAIEQIKNTEIAPTLYFEDEKLADICPFPMKKYDGLRSEKAASFNSALDSHISEMQKTEMKKERMSKFESEKNKLSGIIKKQELQIKGMDMSAEENQLKGEKIYQEYMLVGNILEELKKAKGRYTWQEIKEKLKGHKVIKDINEKERKVTIELK